VYGAERDFGSVRNAHGECSYAPKKTAHGLPKVAERDMVVFITTVSERDRQIRKRRARIFIRAEIIA
jgi:hypothetical protein